MKFINIGKIVNTHGIKGELRILSDFRYKDKYSRVITGTGVYFIGIAYYSHLNNMWLFLDLDHKFPLNDFQLQGLDIPIAEILHFLFRCCYP